MKKTIVISFFGGPGVSKSTTAALLYAKLKEQQKSCELVREYVKIWSWQQKEVTPLDQIYLLGKQTQAESMLYGKVDYIITDSPILLVGAYQRLFFNGDYIQKAAMAVVNEARTNYNVTYKNYVIARLVPYQSEGRFHNEAQAKRVDEYLPKYLGLCNETYDKVLTVPETTVKHILKEII